MSFVGQCPSCSVRYELGPQDIGCVLQCECGAELFACAPAGTFASSVNCDLCHRKCTAQQNRSDGSVVCDCGTTVALPNIELRLPISLESEPRIASSANQTVATNEPPQRKSKPTVHCPSCQMAYEVSKQDLNQQSQCPCGSVFTVTLDANRKLVTKQAIAAEPTKSSDQTIAQPAMKPKPRSWFATLGLASVIAFLLISIVMFLMRDKGNGSVAAKSTLDAAQQPVRDVSKRYSPAEFALALKLSGFDLQSGFAETTSELAMQAHAPEPILAQPASDLQASEDPAPSAKLRLPPLAERSLPKATTPRTRIPVERASIQGLTFEKAYELAFADYRQTRDFKLQAEKSNDAKTASEFHARLSRTLGLLQQTHDIGTRNPDNKKEIAHLRYFLAWTYYQAGALAEASVLGEALARWGDKEDPATKEAALIGLAAAQEANLSHWGNAQRVGELDQMRSIARVIAARWPEDPQLATIQMSIAQAYDAFGQADAAAELYSEVPESSKNYDAAQFAAGNVWWNEYRRRNPNNSEPDAEHIALLRAARAHLVIVNDAMRQSTKVPTHDLMNVKLTLSRIDLLLGNPQAALKWMTAKPFPLVESIVVAKPTKQQIAMPAAFVRSVFEALFAARSQTNDSVGAKASLQQMSKLLGPGAGGELNNKMLGVAVNFVTELKATPRITTQQIKTLEGLIAPLRSGQSQLSADNMLWFGESWSELAEHAAADAMSKQCYANAARHYADALKAKDFPKTSLLSGRMRQAKLLRLSGQLAEAITVTEQILAEMPNVFPLQIESAAMLEELAFSKADPLLLVDAVDGPANSPIWGWKRLVTTLHGVRFSASGTEQHTEQLLQAQLHLAQDQWLLGKATVDPVDKSTAINAVGKMVSRLLKTTSQEQQPWFGRIQKLSEMIGS